MLCEEPCHEVRYSVHVDLFKIFDLGQMLEIAGDDRHSCQSEASKFDHISICVMFLGHQQGCVADCESFQVGRDVSTGWYIGEVNFTVAEDEALGAMHHVGEAIVGRRVRRVHTDQFNLLKDHGASLIGEDAAESRPIHRSEV